MNCQAAQTQFLQIGSNEESRLMREIQRLIWTNPIYIHLNLQQFYYSRAIVFQQEYNSCVLNARTSNRKNTMNKEIARLQGQVENSKRDIRRCRDGMAADPMNRSLANKLTQLETVKKDLESKLKIEMAKKV